MSREVIDGKQISVKLRSRNPKIEFDRLQMYFGDPYVIDLEDATGSLTIYEPSIGDIVRIGEAKFYETLNVYITNTTANKLMLWENGIDWCNMSDYELFSALIQTSDPEVNKLFFGDLDIRGFERVAKQIGDEQVITLYNKEADVEINEMVYHHISQYLRTMFNMFPEEKITKSSVLKKWYIEADKREQARKKNDKEKSTHSMQALISAYINHPGTKYKLKDLKEVGVSEFYDSVQRLQIYESATACIKGMYSGFVDGKSIKPEDYDFMKDIERG